MLRRIAELLDIPATAFLDGVNAGTAADDTAEIMQIWAKLEHASDRRKILSFARAIAAARE